MFKSSFGGKHSGEWGFSFVAEAAALEAKMLADDICISELSRACKVAEETMKRFLRDGVHNKAWRQLKSRHWL